MPFGPVVVDGRAFASYPILVEAPFGPDALVTWKIELNPAIIAFVASPFGVIVCATMFFASGVAVVVVLPFVLVIAKPVMS